MYRSTGNASSMHVGWQGTQTFFSRWNAKSQIRSLVCTLRNSNIAITSLVCTLRNSKCAFRIKIQNTHFAVMWKQSKRHADNKCGKIKIYYIDNILYTYTPVPLDCAQSLWQSTCRFFFIFLTQSLFSFFNSMSYLLLFQASLCNFFFWSKEKINVRS